MTIVYSFLVAWAWGNGWLYQMGYVDFAGSGVVHMTGGIAGFITCIILGPRAGKFKNIREYDDHKHNSISVNYDITIKNDETQEQKMNGFSEVLNKYHSGEWDL